MDKKTRGVEEFALAHNKNIRIIYPGLPSAFVVRRATVPKCLDGSNTSTAD